MDTEYLKKALEKAQQELGEDIVIYARPGDIASVRTLTELPVEQDNSISLGGINATCPKNGLFVSYTLDSRLAEQKAKFPDRSELRL